MPADQVLFELTVHFRFELKSGDLSRYEGELRELGFSDFWWMGNSHGMCVKSPIERIINRPRAVDITKALGLCNSSGGVFYSLVPRSVIESRNAVSSLM